MALPKRKHCNARTRKRRSHYRLSAPQLTACGHCNTMILVHNACYKCGYYQGRKADHTVSEEEKKKQE